MTAVAKKIPSVPTIYVTKKAQKGLTKQLTVLTSLRTKHREKMSVEELCYSLDESTLANELTAWYAAGYIRAWMDWSGLSESEIVQGGFRACVDDVSNGNLTPTPDNKADLTTTEDALEGIRVAMSGARELCEEEGVNLTSLASATALKATAMADCVDAWDLAGYLQAWMDWSGAPLVRLVKNFG